MSTHLGFACEATNPRLRRNLNDSSCNPEHLSDKFRRLSFHLHIETYVALFLLSVEAMTSEREREAKSTIPQTIERLLKLEVVGTTL